MKLVVALSLVFVIAGCALTDAELDVTHDPGTTHVGPLSEVAAITFVPVEMADLREDTERIGYKKNGHGANTANIRTEEPVSEIVREALVHAMESNGHVIGGEGVAIRAAIRIFWVDLNKSTASVEVIGTVSVSLSFSDGEDGDSIYERDYKGSYSHRSRVPTNGDYDAAISGAVANLIDEIVFDEDLAAALSEHLYGLQALERVEERLLPLALRGIR